MATVRDKQDTTNQALFSDSEAIASLVRRVNESGGATTISTLLSLLDAINAQDTGNTALLAAVNGIRTDMAANEAQRVLDVASTLSSIETNALLVNSGVGLVRTDTTTIITIMQGMVTTQALLYNALLGVRTAIYATACACDSGAPALPPVFNPNNVASLTNHCLRVQFVVDGIKDAVCSAMAALSAGAGISFAIAGAMLGAGVIPGIDIGSIPVAILSGLVGALAVLSASKFDAICSWLETNYEGLVNTLFNAQNASSAQQAWYAYVDAHTNAITELDIRLVLKTLPWTGVLNVIYNDTELDTSGFNSNNCGVYTPQCTLGTSEYATITGNFSSAGYFITSPVYNLDLVQDTGYVFNGNHHASIPVFYAGDVYQYTVKNTNAYNISCVYHTGPVASEAYVFSDTVAPGDVWTCPATNPGAFWVVSANAGMTATICPSGVSQP